MKSSRYSETLFTNTSPTALGFMLHSEDEFTYMNSHADQPVIAMRERLESWYTHYPIDHRTDLASRFRSSRISQHNGAFWELYLHELFRRMKFEVQIHPSIENVQTHPDLLLLQNGSPYAYVEARLAGMLSDKLASEKRLKAELHDTLNRVHSPNFFFLVDELRSGPTRPSFKQLTRKLEKWLATLDPDVAHEKFLVERSTSMRFHWEQDSWFLSLKVAPKRKEHRGKPNSRPLGSTGFEVEWLDTRGELRSALDDKTNKYGELQLPLVIAINYMGVHCDRTDWTDALYGSQAVNIWFGEDGSSFQVPFRKDDGFWVQNGNAHHRHVSAVIGGHNVTPSSMGAYQVEVYEHFSARWPIGFNDSLPCWRLSPNEGELIVKPGRSSADILNIPPGWPGTW